MLNILISIIPEMFLYYKYTYTVHTDFLHGISWLSTETRFNMSIK